MQPYGYDTTYHVDTLIPRRIRRCWGKYRRDSRKAEEKTDLKERLSRVENTLEKLAGMETRIDHLEARVAVLTLESPKQNPRNSLTGGCAHSEGRYYSIF